MPCSRTQVLHSYRHLYRQLLHAVQFSTPARHVARDRLRHAFRKGKPTDYQHESIVRTLEFLRGATEWSGLEHRILANLLHVGYWEWKHQMTRQYKSEKKGEAETRRKAYAHFNQTVEMLNLSLGLCLR
ncbi:MAG: hypothetical protein M1816_002959 [Peltula sp. TS41687]|nr:MAG: hypothetical protein M1816_002959 [Peltula sp. TS41687]